MYIFFSFILLINIPSTLCLTASEIPPTLEEIIIFDKRNKLLDFLSKFFYILLIIAKFIGTGEIKEPNLIKLGEYYGNLFTCCILLENNISDYNLQDLFEKYINYKSILIESIYNNNYGSETIDEIIKYIDIYITKNLK